MLHLAVQGCSLKSVVYLRGKVSVNSPDERGSTALHWACHHGYLPIVKYLLAQSETALNYADHDGNTPLHLAVRYEHSTVIEALLLEGASRHI